MKITTLTKDQAARMPEWVERWLEIGLSTAPADFEAAQDAALRAYKVSNLGRPMVVLRMGSPYGATLGGILAWAMLREIEKLASQVGSQVRSQVGSQVRSQVWSQVGSQVWSQVRSQVRSQVWSQVRSQVGSQVRSQVWSQVGSQVRQDMASSVWNYRGGAFWASWCAYIAFFRDVMGWDDPTLKLFEIDEQITRSCGWVWWHENVCAISDRPEVLRRDSQGRPHCESGPSIRYRDGWALYHWHGLVVPEYVIERPAEITVSRIDSEQNAEVRRVMLERYGAARYLADARAELVHQDECGVLYRRELPDDEPLVMVRVLNPTPEPDGVLSESQARRIFGDEPVDRNLSAMRRVRFILRGSRPKFKEYWLRVPPSVRTAREAVAWTFDVPAKDYQPAFQS